MPQNPISYNAVNPSGKLVPLAVNTAGALLTASAGTSSKLDLTAPAVVKAAPGSINLITVLTSATFTINDCLTVGAAATTNQIYNATTLAAGTVVNLAGFPCTVGITVGVLSAGSISLSYS